MSFNIPKINKAINEKNIKIKFSDNVEPYITKSLSKYLKIIKNKITVYPSEWNHNKKYTNIYEFIHTNITTNGHCISQLTPISRAFYKLVEIINTGDIIEKYKFKNIKTFHIAEAPGGFIEAISYLRKNKNDFYYGTTLLDSNDPNIPYWKKSKIVSQNNIIIENGVDNTGNLYNENNFLYFNEKYFDSFEIVTADGGIDFSQNYEK